MADIMIQNCKKCQLPINEGHAYELGDHRWHISCFKCSKCDNSLGCNSNFLVLGNGNLICSNCSYNCKQCDKKIDDLAILTGDQAYCTNCFKCRACKQKIEDLKYARTSKGLFCMNCHEKLINKKKKYDAKKKHYIADKHSSNGRNSLINGYLNTSYQNLSTSSLNSSPQIFNHLNSSNSSVAKNLPNLPEIEQRDALKESIHSDSKGSLTSHVESKNSTRDSFQSALTADSVSSLINFNESPQIANRESNDFSIEEINDSDIDEQPMKRAPSLRQKLNPIQRQLLQEKKLAANASTPNKPYPYKSDDNGSIFLDIIDTPSDYQSPIGNISPINQLAPPVDLSKPEETQPKLEEPKVFDELPTPPEEQVDSTLSPDNKNLLLLSPNQFHDHEFHTASMEMANKKNGYKLKPPSKSPQLEVPPLEPPEDPKSRSGALSPFAKINRHARVVESNDYVSTDTVDVDVQSTDHRRKNSVDNSISTNTSTLTPITNTFSGATPKRKPPPTEQYTSPPPKLPLPSTPTIKSSKQPTKSEDTPKGLGLQGIDFYNEQLQNSVFEYDLNPNQTPPKKKSNDYLTQTVTNLEDVTEKKDEDSDSQSLSRVSSIMRTPKLSLLKHKRSISGGSNSLVNKFGFFRTSKDEQRGHGRTPSETSVGGNEIFHTVPLGTSAQVHTNTPFSRDHIRSTSDTGVHTIEQFNVNDTKEYLALKEEVSQLSSQKYSLDSEVKRLYNEKYSLTEQTKIMQSKLTTSIREHESLLQEIADLKIQKKKFLDINQSLSEQNHSLEQSWTSYQTNNNSSSNSTLPNTMGENIRKVTSGSPSVSGSTVYQQSSNQGSSVYPQSSHHTHSTSSTYINEIPIEESSEPQRAARLKFWKRKGGTQANLVNINESYNNNNKNNSSNNSLGKQTSHGSLNDNGEHHNNSSGNYLNVEKMNKFVKSRSTNILDSFLNGSGSNTNVSSTNNGNNNNNSNHHRHASSVSHQPRNSPNKEILGDAPLYTSTIQQRADYEKAKVPLIITKCIEEVENRGLDTEGIYRISGGNSAIVAIENAFASIDSDQKSLVKLDEVLDGDINAVTSALKRYLRKLPEPLIPYSLYDEFIKVSSNNAANKHEKRTYDLKVNVLSKLPSANKHALFLLCKHLVLIDSYSSINRMGFKNLSVVFAPTIARDKSGEREMLDMGYRNNVIELLLTNAEQLFDDYSF